MKKIFSVILSLIMLLGVMPIGVFTASALTEGGFDYTLNSKNEAQITGCDETISGDVVIPETLGEKPVKSIALYAFAEKGNITSVTIPDSITKIENNAFSDCTALKTVKIGSGVVDFANFVFSGCSALEKTEVSADNTILSSDENGVLYNKDKTELVLFPAQNTITVYSVIDSVKVIKDGAFMGSANVRIIEIKDNVTEIGANAFLGSINLETVMIGKSVSVIGANAFHDCLKLAGVSVSSENNTYSSDANYVLFNKDKTMLLKYPAGSARSEYKVPSTVQEISEQSFYDVIGLKKITIPKSVKNIASSAFYGCNNISEVIYEGTKAEFDSIVIGSNNSAIKNAKIEYLGEEKHEHKYSDSITKKETCTSDGVRTFKCECGSTYTEAINAKGHKFENNICDNCGDKEFLFISDGHNVKITGYNGNAVSLIIPEKIEGQTVNAIGDNAFENHSEIMNIAIPDTVEDVGSNAFYRTGYYNKVSNWENGVLYIGKVLIEGQKNIKGNLTVKDGTKVIADYAFASVKNITSVTLPNTLVTIGDYAFSGCTAISLVETKDTEEEFKSVVIGSKNESLINADFTFYVPPHYHAYVVTDNVEPTCTKAGYKTEKCACGDEKREDYPALGHDFVNNACSRCKEREFELDIIDGAVVIKGAHSSLSGTVVIPKELISYPVKGIGENAFEGNENITKLVIPVTVESIGKTSFKGSKINEIEVDSENANFASENGILFNKAKTELIFCPSAKAGETVTIPEGVKKIASGSFSECTQVINLRLPESLEEICADAFLGATGVKSVYFAGTQTQWKNISVDSGNDVIKNASFTFGNTSDSDAAKELVSKLVLKNAIAEVDGIEITIKAQNSLTSFVCVGNKTSDGENVVIDCKNTLIELVSNDYTLSVADWHRSGNKTVVDISTDKHTFVIKFVFIPEDDGHIYGEKETVAANCVSYGCDRYTCTICNNVKEENIVPKLGHSYGNWVQTKPESCSEEGEMCRECSVCSKETEGHFEYDIVPKIDHKYTAVTTEATCTEGGYTTHTCSMCGYNYKDNEVSAKGHKFDSWSSSKEASCTQNGERTGVCTACGQNVKEIIPALGHNYIKKVVPPAVGQKGYTRYTCTRCEHYYDDNFVPALSKIISVSTDNIKVNAGEPAKLIPKVETAGETVYTVKYLVADESVATVDEDGNINAITRGVTVVTCTVTDEDGNSYNAVCTIEVTFTVLQWIRWFFVDVLLKLIISMF